MTIRNISVLTLFMASATLSNAVLPPGATQGLKDNAQEELLVSVVGVHYLLGQDPDKCLKYYGVEAEVVRTAHSHHNYTAGDKVEFQAYHFDQASKACQGFAGPTSPQQLHEGWCGLVYLDQKEDQQFLSLAAYGDSLEQESAIQCRINGGTRRRTEQTVPEEGDKKHKEANWIDEWQRSLMLGPGTGQDLKENAQEVLLVSVDKLSSLLGQNRNACLHYLNVEAEIVQVNSTSHNFTAGNKVEFQSYHYDQDSPACQDFTGPAPPQQLREGWCGYVYLNQKKGDVYLSLAAYGESLEEKPSEQCSANAPGKTQLRGSN